MPTADRSASVNGAASAANTWGSDAGDQARAETDVPFGADDLFDFISDIERLFRLNPHLEIETWQVVPGGFHLTAKNEMNECRVDTAAHIVLERQARSITIRYETGLKRLTTLAVAPYGTGSRLVAVDHYPVIADSQDPRVAEVDRSLVPWIASIRRHLVQRARWGGMPGWRWWNEGFMPGMPPRQRRIVRMIIWVSVLEFVVFLFVAAIYWLERHSG